MWVDGQNVMQATGIDIRGSDSSFPAADLHPSAVAAASGAHVDEALRVVD
jgi:hypothetical protein